MSLLRRLLHTLIAALLVPVLLFEEWGWTPLAAQVAKLARLPLWARLERWLCGLPPWAALCVFVVPILGLLPVKLLALLLFSQAHYTGGIVLLGGAKLAGTALVARLFQLLRPTLMRLPWFARWYPRWVDWKDHWLEAARRSAPWRALRRLRTDARRRWRVFRRNV